MSHYDERPVLGATFQPGGADDYYMPSVVSPAPQRRRHELPGQIQDGIQRLEIDVNNTSLQAATQLQANAPPTNHDNHHGLQSRSHKDEQRVGQDTERQAHQIEREKGNPNGPSDFVLNLSAATDDEPDFSPFPKLDPRPLHVPESDEEHLHTLGEARSRILNSTDPEKQLAWAQDALKLVDILAEQEERVSTAQAPRGSTPGIERQICTDAMNIVMFLSDQQHPKANFIKGMWLEFGKFGQRQDKVEAFRCYKRAATKGYARAEYRMGMQFESTNEPVKALQHYQQGEALEDSASCYRMGMMSLLGQLGQPQDFSKAVRLIRKAAEGADENAPQGAYVYGMLQAKELPQIKIPEIFLPFDLDSARRYVERAAFLGFPKALLKMGAAYELCLLGCEFNPSLSLHYNSLAATRGEAEAEMAISKWFLCGFEGLFHKSEELAFKYARRAADTGLPMAEFAMGYYNEIGVYVPVNVNEALEWYQKAANNGNKDARDRISAISSSRTLSKTDHEQVAVSRIKSHHGSRLGGRPETLQRLYPQNVSNIPDDRPRNLETYPNGLDKQYQGEQTTSKLQCQNQHSHVVPYPVDDRPIPSTPYPVDDSPRQTARPPPIGGFFAPDQVSRKASTTNNFTSQYHDPLSRVSTGGPTSPYPQQGRTETMNNERSFSTPPLQRPSPGQHGPETARSGGAPASGRIPASRMLANSRSPPVPGKHPVMQNNEANSRLDSRSRQNIKAARPDPSQVINQSSQSPLFSHHSETQISPFSGISGRSAAASNAKLPGVSSASSQPLKPSQSSTNFTSATPPKAVQPSKHTKGPQTFEEMGVPTAKQDNDCTLM